MTEPLRTFKLFFGPRNDRVMVLLEDQDANRLDHFNIDPDEANDRSDDLRKALREWAAACQDGDDDRADRWMHLVDQAGLVFENIFRGSRVAELLSKVEGELQLLIQMNCVHLSVPWGLLCNPADVETAKRDLSQRMLWAAKYNVRVCSDQGWPSMRKHEPWRFHPVLCERTYRSGVSMLPAEAAPIGQAIVERRRGPRESSEGIDSQPNCFFYVHSHSHAGTRLLFEDPPGAAKSYSAIELIDPVCRRPEGDSGIVLAVLNACGTDGAYKNLAKALVTASHLEVSCVATEIAVDQLFAMQFGLELIDRCVERGESAWTALRAMRRNHYPMSVIYSYHSISDAKADPTLRLFDAESLSVYRDWLEGTNFSDLVGAVA